MSRTADELLAEVLGLPEEARARFAQSLIVSLDDAEEDEDPAVIEQAWLAEIFRRAAEIDGGLAHTRPAAEVFRDAREELRGLRARRESGG